MYECRTPACLLSPRIEPSACCHGLLACLLLTRTCTLLASFPLPACLRPCPPLPKQMVDFHGELVLMLHWSLVNYAAVAKILKKHDKMTGCVSLLGAD